jgi:MFS family permease
MRTIARRGVTDTLVRPHDRPTRDDLAWLGGLTVLLVVVFAWPGVFRGWVFGPGPDETVYLWWTRVGAAEGISLVGARPGVVALIASAGGALGLPVVPAVAGLQQALGVAIGLAAVALVHGRSRGGRPGWALVGLLAGVFAVHLAAGYVSNLAFAGAFLAAAAGLARRSRRGTLAAALLLGGGGLSHPQFFVVGAAILAAAAAVAWLLEPEHGWRSDAGRVSAAVVGGGAIVGGGLLAAMLGPARLPVDTSKDGFLRRAGLDDPLTRNYLFRFRENLRRFAPWVTVPLATIGSLQVHGFTRRFLIAWAGFTIVGVPLGIATGWFPPERVMTFGFALPILAAQGITWLWDRTEPRRWLTVAATATLVALMVVPAVNAQRDQSPFMSREDLAVGTLAGRIAATLPPETPLVFVVDDPDRFVTFNATNVANIARATVPPDRADDVFVFVGRLDDLRTGRPTSRGEPEYDALSRLSLADLPDGERAIFVAPEWNRSPAAVDDERLAMWTGTDGVVQSARLRSSVAERRTLPAGPDELAPSSAAAITVAAIAVLALLWLIGAGWSAWAFDDRVAAMSAAPAFGVAALTIVALALERVGVPLDVWWGAALASAVAGLGGYAIVVVQGRASVHATTEVDEAPARQHEHGGRHEPVPDP